MDMVKEFIRPELLVLVPVLYLIGMALKRIAVVDDRFIPVILGTVGVILSMLYLGATSELATQKDVMLYFFVGITQGVLVAGASVYINQLYKQRAKSD